MAGKPNFAEDEAMGYNITILGRNVQVTEAMKNYAWDKLTKIERFHNHIIHAFITLDIQKLEHVVTILLKFDHFEVTVHAASTDMYVSIDKAIDRLQTKFRRWKDKIQDHSKKGVNAVDMRVNVLQKPYRMEDEINDEIEAENAREREEALVGHHIIGTDKMILKVLLTDEALMKMELSDRPFLIFRDEADRKLKVIYRRPDGNYGVVQAEE
jgi:putative sigma-54 modulation protein